MTEQLEQNPLGLSDEDIDSFDWNSLVPDSDEKTEEEETEETTESESIENETIADSVEEKVEETTESTTEEVINESSSSSDNSEGEALPDEKSESNEDFEEGEGSDEELEAASIEQEPTEVNYQEEYNKVLAPFKANGKMIQADNVEEVRTLMQMGANYSKKMAALKPNLKIVKMLENQDLLDETKISYLIDLSKKNPEAIKKLIKESELDLDTVDPEQEISYQPNKSYTVNDNEIELDGILAEIRDTETYATTMDVVGNKWDESSQQIIVKNPYIIKELNTHIGDGRYAQIMGVVEKKRILGELGGVSDIDAYKQIGDTLHAAGVLGKTDQAQQSNVTKVQATKPTKNIDPNLAKKRKAASSTKSLPKKAEANFNPLAMSDEEFEKHASAKYS